MASTQKGAWILDPFTGSSTTGIAANLLERRFLGIDKEEEFLLMSKARKMEIEQSSVFSAYRKKLKDIACADALNFQQVGESDSYMGYDLPF